MVQNPPDRSERVWEPTPSPGPRRLMKTPPRATLSPKGERATIVFHLPTAYCLLPTAYCLLPTAYCLLPTAYCLLPTAYRLLPTAALPSWNMN